MQTETENSTHTPAPWEYESIPDKARVDPDLQLDPAEQFWIVTPGPGPTEILASVYHTLRDANAEANARLIAAAPDLLAALKNTRAQAFNCIVHSGTDREFALLAVADADAAIAKAEGR